MGDRNKMTQEERIESDTSRERLILEQKKCC